MAAGFYETGAQLFARLGAKPSLENLDINLFPKPHLTLKPGHVVELYGTTCCAKTEILYHLIARCILPPTWQGIQLEGHNIGVVFVDAEYQFSMLRLFAVMEKKIAQRLEMIKSEQSQQIDLPTSDHVEGLIKTSLSKLYLVKCTSSEQLIISLHSLESLLANHPEVGVMMLDCVSAFYWTDRTSAGDNMNTQEAMQRKMTHIIQRLLDEHHLVLIATKPAIVQSKHRMQQETSGSVTDAASPLNQSFSNVSHTGGPEIIEHHEYMCRAWHQLVTYRYHIQRHDGIVDKNAPRSVFKVRLIHPNSVKHQVTFCVTESGLSYII